MATRANPFYRFNNPALGQGFAGIAEALFPQPDKAASEIAAREAQAAANMALAAERDQNTRGKQIKNDRFEQMPTGLAEAILSGFQFQEEPMRMNPDYQAPAPIDWSSTNLLTQGLPQQDIQPMMLEGRTRADQLARALQEAQAYGLNLDDMLKSAGMMQYMNNAMGANPQAGLPFAPFVGVSPNAGTALSPTAQNQISARDAREALTQATTVEGMRNQNRLDVVDANNRFQLTTGIPARLAEALAVQELRNDGAVQTQGVRNQGRTGGGTGSTASVPTVTPSTAKNMRESLDNRLKQMGYSNIEPQAVDEMLALSTRLFQDRNSSAFKNTALAVQEAVDMLEMGQVPGVSEVLGRTFFGGERRNLTRVPPGQRSGAPAAPAPAAPAAAPAENPAIGAARAAIAQGAPREAVIKRLRDNGITPPKDL